MTSATSIPVELVVSESQRSSGTIRIVTWSKRERIKRAFRAILICWGLALVSVLLPGLHFLLVPFFVIVSPFAASYVYLGKELVLEGEGSCPKCQQPIKIGKSKVQWPIFDLCKSCQSSIRIWKKDE